MTVTRSQFIGQIQRPGQRPESVTLIADQRPSRENPIVFTAADATPSVLGFDLFQSDTGALTITDLDDGTMGQEITIVSKGAITFDVTGTNLNGGTVDIVTAAGDITKWICEDGTTWHLTAFVDMSVDNSGGA